MTQYLFKKLGCLCVLAKSIQGAKTFVSEVSYIFETNFISLFPLALYLLFTPYFPYFVPTGLYMTKKIKTICNHT